MESNNEIDVVKHYTDYKTLKLILEKGLKFSDGSKWTDKNDLYGITKYKEVIKKRVLVLCFCDGKGNVHHWTRYGTYSSKTSQNTDNVACSIVLNKKGLYNECTLFPDIKDPREVNYCSFDEIQSYSISDIPYLKRKEYEVEKEIRILVEQPQSCNKDVYLPVKEHLDRIVIGPCSDKMFDSIKKELIALGVNVDKIGHNSLNKSKKWQQEIDSLIDNCNRK